VGVSTVRQWMVHNSKDDSGSPLLVQIFMSMACNLLFITEENTSVMMVTMLKKIFIFFFCELALSNHVIVLFVSVVVFHGNK